MSASITEITSEKLTQVPSDVPAPDAGLSKISELLEDAATNAGDSRSLMEPKTVKGKSKGGRPRKNPEDPKWKGEGAQAEGGPAPAETTPAMDMAPACEALFTVIGLSIATASGVPEANFEEKEVKGLAVVWAKVLERYLPDLTSYPELTVAIMVTLPVGLRVSQTIMAVIHSREEERVERAKVVTSGGNA